MKYRKKVNSVIGTVCSPAQTFAISVDINKKYFEQVMEQDFIYIFDKAGHKVIGRITTLTAEGEDTSHISVTADADIKGYVDKDGSFCLKRFPLMPGSSVRSMSPRDVVRLLKLEHGLYLGNMVDSNTPVRIDVNDLTQGHTFVTAKTKSGKSWFLGALLEETSKIRLPVLVVDPHGEYHSLKEPWEERKLKIKKWGLKPRGFPTRVVDVNPDISKMQFGQLYIWASYREEKGQVVDGEVNVLQRQIIPISQRMAPKMLTHRVRPKDIHHWVEVFNQTFKKKPVITSHHYPRYRLGESESHGADIMWDGLDFLVSTAEVQVPEEMLIRAGEITIIDCSKIDPDMTRIAVGTLLDCLFQKRKKGEISPFMCLIEEAHKFCHANEKYYSTVIMETLSKEARKYGMPCFYVSQRPSLVSTTVRANCENWIVLKTTHPSDQNAIVDSCEGLDSRSKEMIKNLPVGYAFLTGSIVDLPIVIQVRYRQSKHSYSEKFMDMVGMMQTAKGEQEEEND